MTSNTNQNTLKYNNKDYVRQDGVIKEQVFLEKLTRKNYDRKWGYMTTFNKMCTDIAEERGLSKADYMKMVEYKKGQRITSKSSWDIPASPPVSITVSGEVGWRSSQLGCNLERLGPLYISPRHTLTPPDMEPEPKLTNIFLG